MAFLNNKINKKALLAITVTCMIGWGFAFLAINVYRDYAFGLFIWLPIVIGAISTLLYGYKNPIGKKTLRNNTYLTLLIFCLGLLVFAWEGIICLIMAAPVGFFFTWVGYRIGYALLKSDLKNNVPISIIVFLISVPVLMAFESSLKNKETLHTVATAIEINAPAETVWENVIAFSQLKEPTEFIFKTGIAYPVNATIKGNNVGAIRYCNFSTGSFVEPITIWDEPKLLKFSVTDQPEPMKELSPYDIHPNHLHGFWVSKEGQFKLTPLPNGHTLLEGTTWYENKIKPDFYWRVWSDYIVHKIHTRVLAHIKDQSETNLK